MTRSGSWWWSIKVLHSEGLSLVKMGLGLVLPLLRCLDSLSPSRKIEVEQGTWTSQSSIAFRPRTSLVFESHYLVRRAGSAICVVKSLCKSHMWRFHPLHRWINSEMTWSGSWWSWIKSSQAKGSLLIGFLSKGGTRFGACPLTSVIVETFP